MRVGIVNDQRLATEALRRVVSSDPDLEIAWMAVDGREAVQKCAADLPDVVLMDLVMPGMNGFAGELLILVGMFQRAWAQTLDGPVMLYRVISEEDERQ